MRHGSCVAMGWFSFRKKQSDTETTINALCETGSPFLSKTIHGIECPIPLQVRLELSQFSFLRAIGHGCGSTVFEAMHTPSKTRCAIKICMKRRLHQDAERRIRREIQTHSILSHPNILKFYACFEDTQAFYFVLEYADNSDLLTFIQKKYKGLMPLVIFRVTILMPLLRAVSHLHKMHIIHRDIKPENILVDEKGMIKLCDFGFSINSYEERPRSYLGTLEYMAPELILQHSHLYSEKLDVWAIGVLAYECIVGVSPFYDKNEDVMRQSIIDANYVISPLFPPMFVAFLRDTLHPNPEQRANIMDLMDHRLFNDGSHPHTSSLRKSVSFG